MFTKQNFKLVKVLYKYINNIFNKKIHEDNICFSNI